MPIQFLTDQPLAFVVWLLAILYGITVHEFSHALAAHGQGDGTPESYGRLTLNPLAHLDILGFFSLLVFGFGWGKPVPYDPTRLKWQRWGATLVSLAGPFANLVSIFVIILLLKLSLGVFGLDTENLLIQFLVSLVVVNVVLMIFNLIPLPPLDGAQFLFDILPQRFYRFKLELASYGPVLLLTLVIIDRLLGSNILPVVFQTVTSWVLSFV
ncbi:MAG: site-2 protease family protein [bacterium]